MTDEITLTLPRSSELQHVANLVVGGLGARLNLTVETLEDLELALDTVLDRVDPEAGDVTVQLKLHDGDLVTRIGPLRSTLLDEIERETEYPELGMRSVLDATVDDVQVDGDWVRLTKRVGTSA